VDENEDSVIDVLTKLNFTDDNLGYALRKGYEVCIHGDYVAVNTNFPGLQEFLGFPLKMSIRTEFE
jgi:hypothetical protein